MNPKYGWNWVIGGQYTNTFPNTYMNFDSSNPIIPTYAVTQAVTYEAVNTASISDANGNLLFYTNGDKIYDSNNAVVLDTLNTPAQLFGDQYSWYGISIMPDLHTTDEYWIFYVGPWNNGYNITSGYAFTTLRGNTLPPAPPANQLYYSKVKVINNAIIATQLNVPIGTLSSLGTGNDTVGKGYGTALTIVPHGANPLDFWVVVRPGGTTSSNGPVPWESYHVSNTVSSTVIYSVCSNLFTDLHRDGQIKVSPSYKKIAFAVGSVDVSSVTNIDVLTLYDFDNVTGMLSNEQVLFTGLVEYKVADATKYDPPAKYGNISSFVTNNLGFDIKGCEFSNTDNYLYVSVGYTNARYGTQPLQCILQIDISPASLATWTVGIANSIVTIPSAQALYYPIPTSSTSIGGLQRGPDGYIYFTNQANQIWRIRTLDVLLNDATFIIELTQDYSADLNYSIGWNFPNIPMGLLVGDRPVNPQYIKLTPCCDLADPVIIENINFPVITSLNQNDAYCIQGLSPYVNCWTAEYTNETSTGGPITITEIFSNLRGACEECKNTCGGCNVPAYYNLLDCCTGESYKDNGVEIFFNYTIPTNILPGVVPTSYALPTVIKEIKNGLLTIVGPGCYTLNSVNFTPTISITSNVLDWDTNVTTVITEVDCETCADCRTCYLLINCNDGTSFLSASPDLGNYVGQSVYLSGYGTVGYTVAINYAGCNFGGVNVSVTSAFAGGCDESNPCYLFTNCADPTDTFKSNRPEYAQYIGWTVAVVEFPGEYYTVTQGTGCHAPYENNYTVIQGFTDCSSARGCYKFTNCNNSSEVYYFVNPAYGQFVNQYVIFDNRPACFLVEKDTTCQGTIGTTPIVANFISCILCTYALNGGNPIDPKSLIHPGTYKPKYGKKPKCGVTKPNCNNA